MAKKPSKPAKKAAKKPAAAATHGNSKYSPQMVEKICELLVCGENGTPESLRSICSKEGMPSVNAVMRWLGKYEDFRKQYARAKELQQEYYAEEIIDIADDCTDDVIFLTAEDSHGEGAKPVIKHSAIARAKLRIDTRRWLMGKLAPKKYGDKIALGGDDDAPAIRVAADDESILNRFINASKPK